MNRRKTAKESYIAAAIMRSSAKELSRKRERRKRILGKRRFDLDLDEADDRILEICEKGEIYDE